MTDAPIRVEVDPNSYECSPGYWQDDPPPNDHLTRWVRKATAELLPGSLTEAMMLLAQAAYRLSGPALSEVERQQLGVEYAAALARVRERRGA